MQNILPNKYGLIVKFNKEKQRLKKEKKGSIYLPPQFLYMQYYLQHGEITAIGSAIAERFPYIQTGDIALIHHIVEHNPLMLVYEDKEHEYRAVNAIPHDIDHSFSSQVFGTVCKDSGQLRPYDSFLFIDNNGITPLKKEITSSLIHIPDFRNDETFFQQMQEDTTRHRKSLETSMMQTGVDKMYHREEIDRELAKMERQQNKLAELASAPQKVNARVLYSNAEITTIDPGETVMVDKDTLYPITIGDISYFIIRSGYVEKYDMVFD